MSTTLTYAATTEAPLDTGHSRTHPRIIINTATDASGHQLGDDNSQLPEFQLSQVREHEASLTASTPRSPGHASQNLNFGPRAPRISRIRQNYPSRSPLPPALLPAHVTHRRSEANLRSLRNIRPPQQVAEPVSRVSVMDLPGSFSRTMEPTPPPHDTPSSPTRGSHHPTPTDPPVEQFSAPAASNNQSLTPEVAFLTTQPPHSREFLGQSVHLSDAPQSMPLEDQGEC